MTDIIYTPMQVPEAICDLFPMAEGAQALVRCADGHDVYAGHVIVATPIG